VTSRARQLQQAVILTAGHGVIVAESFDTGESRALPWTRRPQAAALVAALADPDRGWDAIVIGEYERAFYGNQFASMAPLFEHYGIQLWMPEAGGRVEPARGLGHLQASRAHGAGQRSRLHRCPGHHGAARPRRPGGTPVPAGRAAGLRAMRAQAGISVV
jgi:hypothetical protein